MTGFIKNRGPQPITVCFQLEEEHREDRQAQPFAFSVERLQQGEWTTVLTTLGRSSGHTQVIKPGENIGFPFTLRETGQYRLVLQYWLMDNPPTNCADLHNGTEVKSKPFSVSD